VRLLVHPRFRTLGVSLTDERFGAASSSSLNASLLITDYLPATSQRSLTTNGRATRAQSKDANKEAIENSLDSQRRGDHAPDYKAGSKLIAGQ
jgi:hypothetical protein